MSSNRASTIYLLSLDVLTYEYVFCMKCFEFREQMTEFERCSRLSINHSINQSIK